MKDNEIVTINVPFTKEEHAVLKDAKGTLSWHDFILSLVEDSVEK